MKRLVSLLLLFSLAIPGWGAWADVAGHCNGASESSTNSLSCTWASTAPSAGDAVIIIIATDNTGTTDGDLSEINSVTDSKSNTYTEIKEWTNGQGTAATGATVGAYYSVLSTGLTAGVDTITVNFANNVVAKTMEAHRFTIGSGHVISVAGTIQTEVVDNGDAANLTISSLTSAEYMFMRVIASETDGDGITPTTSYSTTNMINRSGTGGSEKGHMSVDGEYRILTGTTDSSNPTLTDITVDLASVYFALSEAAPPATTGVGWYSPDGWF